MENRLYKEQMVTTIKIKSAFKILIYQNSDNNLSATQNCLTSTKLSDIYFHIINIFDYRSKLVA